MTRARSVAPPTVTPDEAFARGGKPAVAPPSAVATPPIGYLQVSALPLTSLLFLIPLVVVYEVGTRWYAFDPVNHVQQRIIAFNLMREFFGLFGATGQYLPAAAVVSILLAWHLARDDQAFAGLGTLVAMHFEAAMYAVPLVGLGFLFQHFLPLHTQDGDPRALLVLSIGAGVYEELMFRLVAFTLIHFVLVDLLHTPKPRATVAMVVISAVAFSLYHYLGRETFAWQSFTFRTLAGIYFGLIFVWRGFGLTAGSHAGYDLIVVALRAAQFG